MAAIFRTRIAKGAPIVAIVNQTLAQRRWPNVDPVGQRIRIPRLFGINPDGWITVVGVAGDVRSTRLDREPTDQVFLPFEQASAGVDVVIRTGTDLAQSIQNARKIVTQVDPETALGFGANDGRDRRGESGCAAIDHTASGSAGRADAGHHGDRNRRSRGSGRPASVGRNWEFAWRWGRARVR
jgi:hypothetical protein